MTVGLHRWMCNACRPVATLTRSLRHRSGSLSSACQRTGRSRCSSLTLAMIPCEALARELAELDGQQVAVLVRLRSDRCFYADPPPVVGDKVGRPRRHGQKFACADERTWWTPTSEHHEEHTQYGSVRVR